ncbi:MAG: hypothetical protein QCH99_11395, partial [Candidatus Bathyarchaeota archaeon]|nr:hypothetical protein [Candidatus Bathyarchaeum tardum]
PSLFFWENPLEETGLKRLKHKIEKLTLSDSSRFFSFFFLYCLCKGLSKPVFSFYFFVYDYKSKES